MTTTGRPTRVLHVLGTLQRGGVENRLVEWLRRADPGRHAFEFCLLGTRPGAYAPEVTRLGAGLRRCPLRPQPATFLPRFLDLLRTGGYDVVHSHVHQFSGVVLLAARLAGVPVRVGHLWNTHDGQSPTIRRRAYRQLSRVLLDRNATNVIGVSECVMDAFWGPGWRRDPRKVVIPGGVEVERFVDPAEAPAVRAEFAVPDVAPLAVHVGRFDPQKNHRALPRIAAALCARQPDATFLLVGDGPLKRSIEESVAQQGLTEHFRFAGARDDVARLVAAADVFVFPSLWEGLPGAVLEALAAGVPVVASPIAPVIEIARQARGVTIADPARPAEFAGAIDGVLKSRPPTHLPAEFTAEASLEQLLACYGGRAAG